MYASTEQFVKVLNEKNVHYDLREATPERALDQIQVAYRAENTAVRLMFLFDKPSASVSIRAFDLIKVPEAKQAKILEAINAQNVHFRFAKFSLNTKDFTVQMSMDAVFRNHDVGEICFELLGRAVNICNDAYPELMKALWG